MREQHNEGIRKKKTAAFQSPIGPEACAPEASSSPEFDLVLGELKKTQAHHQEMAMRAEQAIALLSRK